MIAQRIWPSRPAPAPSPPTEVQPGETTGTAGPEAAVQGDQAPDATRLSVREAEAAEVITLGGTEGSSASPYRMAVWLSPVGAAVETVRLSDYAQKAKAPDRYRLLTPIKHDGEHWRSFAVERLILDGGQRLDLRTARWSGRKEQVDDGERAVFTLEVLAGDQPALALERSFTLRRQPLDLQRHDLEETLTVRNLGAAPRQVQVVELGPFGVTSEGRFVQDQSAFAGVRDGAVIDLQVKNFGEISKKQGGIELYPREEGDTSPLSWYGCGNVYFTATAGPVDATGKEIGGVIRSVRSFDLDEDKKTPDDVGVRVVSEVFPLEPGAERTLHTSIYLGPKDRLAFEDARNADYIARDYMQQITHGYGACSFNFLTNLMISLLNWLEKIFGNYGVAIIGLVIVVRALLHPITKKTQVNMMRVQQRMARLHPKIQEIKKRCGNDAMRLNQETMKLYREEGVNPMSQGLSCLPLFLQMPIWVALYSSLRNNVAMRGEGFLWWINDLTAPDALYSFAAPLTIPLLGWKISELNLLPILVGVTMFAQQKLMPKPQHQAAMDSPQAQQAEQMQKIMPYMSLIMIIFFYQLPSGLNLYIMTSSLIGTVEQLYIRRYISREGAAEPAPKKPAEPARTGRTAALFEWLQKKAEEAQKLPSQRDQGKSRR